MEIIVGSTNKTKVQAVQAVLPKAIVTGKDIASGVSAQPFGDEETRDGAICRAKNAQFIADDKYGIGLEGGVIYTGDQLYVCNWGALYTPEKEIFTASGARIALPNEFLPALQKGKELSVLMNDYTNRHDIRVTDGAVGIFTNGLLKRQAMFEQVVTMLYGQFLFHQNKR